MTIKTIYNEQEEVFFMFKDKVCKGYIQSLRSFSPNDGAVYNINVPRTPNKGGGHWTLSLEEKNIYPSLDAIISYLKNNINI